MPLKTINQLRFIGANVLSEVNDALSDLREDALPQGRTELNGLLDEIQNRTDEVLGVAQTFVVDLKAAVLKQNN